MPKIYTKSQRADQDIKTITHRSLVDFGEEQTDKYMAGMKAALGSLAEHPTIGRSFTHEKTRLAYLYFRYVSHVVYYRQRKNDILIVRILHIKMLPEQHL
jgi:toxin ParE1/3/4